MNLNMKLLLVAVFAAAAGAAGAAAVSRPWIRWESTPKDIGLLFPGVPPPVPHAGGRPVEAEPEDDAVTRISRLHDDEKGATCWFVWEPRGQGLALSCLPDSSLNHRLAER